MEEPERDCEANVSHHIFCIRQIFLEQAGRLDGNCMVDASPLLFRGGKKLLIQQ